MSDARTHARRRAAAAAVFLLLTGAVLGIVVDRLWLAGSPAAAAPLTVEAMVADLELEPETEMQVRALLDSMHPVMLGAAQAGPDSLMVTARGVHARLREILPPELRPELRGWMGEHHRRMMEGLGPRHMRGNR